MIWLPKLCRNLITLGKIISCIKGLGRVSNVYGSILKYIPLISRDVGRQDAYYLKEDSDRAVSVLPEFYKAQAASAKP